jgi:4-diphosphocytidyl-2-C-methyl-D-erythritol kinase
MADVLTEPAFAKVNLTLRVLRRRADGYHDIDSLLVYADLADRLSLKPGGDLELTVHGPTAGAAGSLVDNLVLKAAGALAARVPTLQLGAFALDKRLPVAAGLGGGSADAAAALRLLARANGILLDDPRLTDAARASGADVPVCLDPRPRRMQGIGDVLSPPLTLPSLPAVLVNPGVSLSTKDVFDALAISESAKEQPLDRAVPPNEQAALLSYLAVRPNDLEGPAIALAPMIADVLAALRAVPGCRLARMSGSGATCFGLFDDLQAAETAAAALRQSHPSWWVQATELQGYAQGSPASR